MLDVFLDAIIDSIKLLPFLFLTYLFMEYIEHKTNSKAKNIIKKSGKFGPLIGSFLGIFPQCGFSVATTNLYATRVITIGTLLSVYLTTSDEMLPILISESAPIGLILKILAIKLAIGILVGFIVDFIFYKKNKTANNEEKIVELCHDEHCHCEKGIIKSSIKHTLNIFIFIFIISLIINIIFFFIGEETISNLLTSWPLLGPIIAGIVGLIPNCASSVIITELYLDSLISASSLIAGLLVNAGVGLLVLFKTNKNLKENLQIVFILYTVGVLSGIIFEFIGLTL